MDKNETHTELWLFPTDGRLAHGGSPPATRTAIRSGRRTASGSPSAAKRKDDDEAQIYLIAPDGGEARRADLAVDRRVGAALVSGLQAHRLRLVGVAGPQRRQGAGQAHEGAQGRRRSRRTSPSARNIRFWDHWLTDGREPHIFAVDVATGRARDLLAGHAVSRCSRGSRRASTYDISPDGRELAITVDLAPEPRMMNEIDIVVINLVTGRHRTLTAESDFQRRFTRAIHRTVATCFGARTT